MSGHCRGHIQSLFRLCVGFLLGLAVLSPAQADTELPAGAELVQLLEQVQAAARDTDYEGTFTYQHGSHLTSSRLVHLVDGTGERERLETLDGAPREFLRHNEVVQCLVPEQKMVIIQKQRTDRFPGFLLGHTDDLPQYYSYSVRPQADRVAGRKCDVIDITPADNLRYGYQLCVDQKTSLLLRAQTLDADSNIIEQIAFSSLRFGPDVTAEQLQSSWNTQGWKVIDTVLNPADAAAQGWQVALPPGFSVGAQVSRPLKVGGYAIQFVLDDGLAVISLFLEPYYPGGAGRHDPHKHVASVGATNVYRGRIADYWATAIGEVPAATVRGLVEQTEFLAPDAP